MLDTDLIHAAEKGDAQRVRELLTAGADPGTRDRRLETLGFTPLMLAATAGHSDVVAALLDAGADPNAVDDLNAVSSLGIKPAREIWHWRGALARAAEAGHVAVVGLLIRYGAHVNSRDVTEATPLLWAARAGSLEVMSELLRAGADPNLATERGQTPLIAAAHCGSLEAVRLLLDAGTAVDSRDEDGDTALTMAARAAHPSVIALLIERGAKVKSRQGTRALLWALSAKLSDRTDKSGGPTAGQRILETIRLLLEAGADPNKAERPQSETPLSAARSLLSGSKELADSLAARGISSEGFSPHGRERIYADALALIEEHMASGSRKRAPRQARPAKPRGAPAEKQEILSRKSPGPDEPSPHNFSAATSGPDYKEAVAELEQLCGTKAYPLGDILGGFRLNVHSKKQPFEVEKVQAGFLARAAYVFAIETKGTRVAILPTTDKYAAIAAMNTNGANYNLAPEDIIAWLRNLEQEQPFVLTGIGFDFLEGRFTSKLARPGALARRMYEFCPDIVDQGAGNVSALTQELRKGRRLFFWWD